MTPLWRLYAKYLGKNYAAANMPELEGAFLRVDRAFDLTDVTDLCDEVWRELFRSGDPHDGSGIYDLGERCAIPCERFWLEFRCNAFIVETCVGPGSDIYRISELVVRPGESMKLEGRGRLEQAGELFETGPTVDCRDDEGLLGWQACGWVLSAIAVLNSPRAREETAGARKLIGNKYPRAINPALRVTKIYIDIGGKTASGGSLERSQSPKAYHFVRSHVRRFTDGTSTTVRAHWRGDPAFGIRVGTYVGRDRRPTDTLHGFNI